MPDQSTILKSQRKTVKEQNHKSNPKSNGTKNSTMKSKLWRQSAVDFYNPCRSWPCIAGKRSRLLPVRDCVLTSLSAGTNAYMRALTLVNLLKPALAVSRCYRLFLLSSFCFYFTSYKINLIFRIINFRF